MAIERHSLEQPKHNNSRPRLDNFITQNLSEKLGKPISKSLVRKLIMAGAVSLNGQRIRIASKPVFAGAKVQVQIDWEKLNAPQERAQETSYVLATDDILFEDDHLLVVNKIAGLTTQPTLDPKRNNLFNVVKKYLLETRGDEYAGLHHRLDKDTSGVILFTKSKEANLPIATLFQEHRMQKTYVAIVGNPKKLTQTDFTIDNFLKKDPKSEKKLSRYTSTTSGGEKAITQVRVVKKTSEHAVVEAKPITGRTHQIRVHLSEYGCPVLGDIIYGGAFVKAANRLMLHSHILELEHPITKEPLKIKAPLPSEMAQFL